MAHAAPQEVSLTTKNTASLTMGIAAIVVGILALLFGWVPFLGGRLEGCVGVLIRIFLPGGDHRRARRQQRLAIQTGWGTLMRYTRPSASSMATLPQRAVAPADRGCAVAPTGNAPGGAPRRLSAGRPAVALTPITAPTDDDLDVAKRAVQAPVVLGLGRNPDLPLRGAGRPGPGNR
jgi:hypothetical protein